jgi:hypothetical protein
LLAARILPCSSKTFLVDSGIRSIATIAALLVDKSQLLAIGPELENHHHLYVLNQNRNVWIITQNFSKLNDCFFTLSAY